MEKAQKPPIFVLSLINKPLKLKMMIQLINTFRNAQVKTQAIIAAISVGLYFVTSAILEKSYVLSKFPVPYFEQQTSFDAVAMKKWYAHMIEQDTFGIYWMTQFVDFAFIAAVILMGFTVWTFVANFYEKDSFINRVGYKLAYALPLAGAFDILENLVSFFMMSSPSTFNDFLVMPYSAFAVLKFGCWTVALGGLLVLLIGLPVVWIRRRMRKTSLA